MNSSFKKTAIALGLATMLGGPVVANADLFTFDPTGTFGISGDIANVALFDQAPGTALAVGGNAAVANRLNGGPAAGNDFTLFYQANLGTAQFANTSAAFTNGQGGNFFTFVAGFGETVIGASPFPGTASFAFDPANPVNFFNIYRQAAIGDNSTGIGFVNATPILQASITAQPVSNFQVTNATPVLLDQSPDNVDSFGGQQTVTGGGQTQLVLRVNAVNDLYFPDLLLGSLFTTSFFNTSNGVPFLQVDPSRCVNGDPLVPTCPAAIIPSLGALNGGITVVDGVAIASGPDVIFQADGNQSFQRTAVPEPASLALIGLGLGALGFAARRRREPKAS